MKCETYQAKVIEFLPGEEREMPRELQEHGKACAVCREFCKAKSDVLAAIDASLKDFVNQPVPLRLYNLTTELREAPAPGRFTAMPRWLGGLAVVSAALLIAALSWRDFSQRVAPLSLRGAISSAQSSSAERPKTGPAQAARPAIPKTARTLMLSSPKPVNRSTEIIVLPEEQQAFAELVDKVAQDRETALALTRPASPSEMAPVDIALLRIESVEVKPLRADQRE
jgi:hypothetical protein